MYIRSKFESCSNLTVSNFIQSLNTSIPIKNNDFGIVMVVNELQPLKAFCLISVKIESASKLTVFNSVHLLKTLSPIIVTVFGIVIVCKNL